jgi:NAD(P)-dependent dehydrogenase (short-subunit alcohol dehydrogenase family)
MEPFELRGRAAIVTGGGHGIGRAIAEALAARGARVVVADVHTERAEKVAARIEGLAVACDVASADDVQALVARAEETFGPIAVAVSNAGITDPGPDLASTPEQVRRIVDVNLLSHVWMAQAVVPAMVERGGGALIQTISSAALITGPSGMGYTLTKHGALGFAEWISLNHAHLGIRVVCLCPNAVNTGMLGRDEDDESASVLDDELRAALGDVVEPETCAAMALEALDAGRFLALPHERVGVSFKRKADDYDGWLAHTNLRLRRMRGENV